MSSTDGYRVAESNDVDIASANRVMAEFAKAVEPGAWVVDFIPIRELDPPLPVFIFLTLP